MEVQTDGTKAKKAGNAAELVPGSKRPYPRDQTIAAALSNFASNNPRNCLRQSAFKSLRMLIATNWPKHIPSHTDVL